MASGFGGGTTRSSRPAGGDRNAPDGVGYDQAVSASDKGPLDDPLRAARSQGYESARPDVQSHVPRSARNIIDIGCSSGSLGAALKRRQQAVVVGVEPLPEYAREAEDRLDRVFAVDVESFLGGPVPIEAPFDCLIAADILEHLVDPWHVLSRSAALLRPGGTAVVSLPNVAYWRGLWKLVRSGRWPLEDQGIFDRTHLRWFTHDDALALLRQAGLAPIFVEPRYWTSGWHLRWRLVAAKTPLARFLAPQYVISAIRVAEAQD